MTNFHIKRNPVSSYLLIVSSIVAKNHFTTCSLLSIESFFHFLKLGNNSCSYLDRNRIAVNFTSDCIYVCIYVYIQIHIYMYIYAYEHLPFVACYILAIFHSFILFMYNSMSSFLSMLKRVFTDNVQTHVCVTWKVHNECEYILYKHRGDTYPTYSTWPSGGKQNLSLTWVIPLSNSLVYYI